MTDRALSEEAMLLSLRDIHLPAQAAGGVVADLAVVIGLASLAALVLVAVLRLLSLERVPARSDQNRDRLGDLKAMTDQDRRVALLHMLRDLAPERYAALRSALYKPGGGVDLATLEVEVNRLV